MRDAPRKTPPCGNRDCGGSTGICDRATFGRGKLDPYGYWAEPCDTCARAYEAAYPTEEAWPPPGRSS